MTPPPDSWPELDEDSLRQRADSLTKAHTALIDTIDTWRSKRSVIFSRQSWFGSASSAAERKVNLHIYWMESVDRSLLDAIKFHNDAHEKVTFGKNVILDVCNAPSLRSTR